MPLEVGSRYRRAVAVSPGHVPTLERVLLQHLLENRADLTARAQLDDLGELRPQLGQVAVFVLFRWLRFLLRTRRRLLRRSLERRVEGLALRAELRTEVGQQYRLDGTFGGQAGEVVCSDG
ncbi:hypothetical protein [Streptomyces sp. NPDC003877]